ncbi:hypothetical protein GALMADRAFT_143518 [Galerina marginata CBS 339.88]|uniref:Uncharacterized protein n=1 Tax=Galerina marginata (strain CBS 339.88) TaxID=685588 RepID=A0A067SY70_GALM3|nr:hypothetical protein GALMADRAFT_143518 [Galerina marginata CBS 339.88]
MDVHGVKSSVAGSSKNSECTFLSTSQPSGMSAHILWYVHSNLLCAIELIALSPFRPDLIFVLLLYGVLSINANWRLKLPLSLLFLFIYLQNYLSVVAFTSSRMNGSFALGVKLDESGILFSAILGKPHLLTLSFWGSGAGWFGSGDLFTFIHLPSLNVNDSLAMHIFLRLPAPSPILFCIPADSSLRRFKS